MRGDKHPEVSTTSQLDWHPEIPPSYANFSNNSMIFQISILRIFNKKIYAIYLGDPS